MFEFSRQKSASKSKIVIVAIFEFSRLKSVLESKQRFTVVLYERFLGFYLGQNLDPLPCFSWELQRQLYIDYAKQPWFTRSPTLSSTLLKFQGETVAITATRILERPEQAKSNLINRFIQGISQLMELLSDHHHHKRYLLLDQITILFIQKV